jgi:hypothetical protein
VTSAVTTASSSPSATAGPLEKAGGGLRGRGRRRWRRRSDGAYGVSASRPDASDRSRCRRRRASGGRRSWRADGGRGPADSVQRLAGLVAERQGTGRPPLPVTWMTSKWKSMSWTQIAASSSRRGPASRNRHRMAASRRSSSRGPRRSQTAAGGPRHPGRGRVSRGRLVA